MVLTGDSIGATCCIGFWHPRFPKRTLLGWSSSATKPSVEKGT